MEQIIPPSSPQYFLPEDLGIITKWGGSPIKVRGSDDCCKSVLSGDAAHVDSQHLQIHAQDKAIQNPSMHEEGSKMPSPCGEATPTWTTVGDW